jgi:hypothetical protein
VPGFDSETIDRSKVRVFGDLNWRWAVIEMIVVDFHCETSLLFRSPMNG